MVRRGDSSYRGTSMIERANDSSRKSTQTAFRDALGAFATGVTIATTRDERGRPVGVTASSFNSVSLDPPLVLWSLAENSRSRPAFAESGHFAVHVLTAGQEELSNRFARTGEDKFADVEWSEGQLGSPVLTEYAARFECRTRHQYEGGDHIIMVGEVVEFEARDEAPLLFHGGGYAEHRPRTGKRGKLAIDPEQARLHGEVLFGLISQANELGDGLDGAARADIITQLTEADLADLERILRRIIKQGREAR